MGIRQKTALRLIVEHVHVKEKDICEDWIAHVGNMDYLYFDKDTCNALHV